MHNKSNMLLQAHYNTHMHWHSHSDKPDIKSHKDRHIHSSNRIPRRIDIDRKKQTEYTIHTITETDRHNTQYQRHTDTHQQTHTDTQPQTRMTKLCRMHIETQKGFYRNTDFAKKWCISNTDSAEWNKDAAQTARRGGRWLLTSKSSQKTRTQYSSEISKTFRVFQSIQS